MSVIHVCAMKRRRHRNYERPEENKRQATFSFTLPNEESKTFYAVFGITSRQIETLAKLKNRGDSVYKDRRGNKQLYRKFTQEDEALVVDHIN
ncbi:unnamed protein product [Acanthoscelides obtectus]|uniref:Uncharacterized protein n=1 Tax=Acanthoscelides obtectus TaxID=200917 RepID=A0A9P0JHM5_ACAOB|nr:unnamed protein product [Acanthoscelides obtectus]CAK1639851.1 hypothetical protein AOBTE_LOCUS11413 [Acanthoscelides obtectus]